MRYEKATIENADTIYDIVQNTIKAIYPKYYPREVVDFFSNLHNKNDILKDINEERVGIIVVDNEIVGTGSYWDNHITRVYVKPEYQGRGYGSYIMHSIEENIAMNYDSANLDASLPASAMYEHRGYRTIKHEEWKCENDAVLVYEIMEKRLHSKQDGMDCDGNPNTIEDSKLLVERYPKILGKKVTVTVDRAMGTAHPEYNEMIYPINYGYIKGVMAPDGEEQDAYILGEDKPIKEFAGIVIAIIHRNNDVEEKWVVAPEGMKISREEIEEKTYFQEQYFDTYIIM